MTPNEVTKKRHVEVYQNLYGEKNTDKFKTTMYRIGDTVRLTKYKNIFAKGYIPQLTTEIFLIHKVINSDPITYNVISQTDEVLKGSFYKQELQKVVNKDFFDIDEILDKRTKNGKKEILVSWIGYPKSENLWVPDSYMKRL
jgi:trans-2-enoyl-CoA reductase